MPALIGVCGALSHCPKAGTDADYTDAEQKIVDAMKGDDRAVLASMTRSEAVVVGSAFMAPDTRATRVAFFAELAGMSDGESQALAKMDGANTTALAKMADVEALHAEARDTITNIMQEPLEKVQETMHVATHWSPFLGSEATIR